MFLTRKTHTHTPYLCSNTFAREIVNPCWSVVGFFYVYIGWVAAGYLLFGSRKCLPTGSALVEYVRAGRANEVFGNEVHVEKAIFYRFVVRMNYQT